MYLAWTNFEFDQSKLEKNLIARKKVTTTKFDNYLDEVFES